VTNKHTNTHLSVNYGKDYQAHMLEIQCGWVGEIMVVMYSIWDGMKYFLIFKHQFSENAAKTPNHINLLEWTHNSTSLKTNSMRKHNLTQK